LKQSTNVKIAIHLEDFDFVAGKKAFPKPKDMSGFLYRISSQFLKARLVAPDVTLRDKDMVGRPTIIHTPGHTPGSVSVHDPKRSVLFVGDVLSFFECELRGPHFAVDASQEARSVERISQLDFDIMLCGHEDPLKPDASEKVRQFLDTSRSRLKS
jgi:glyoxylase-like metal-dependent hydrolase (beta-lactamase superfamily II)